MLYGLSKAAWTEMGFCWRLFVKIIFKYKLNVPSSQQEFNIVSKDPMNQAKVDFS